MIYHHLPQDEKWQLLQTSINMTQYLQMPKVHPTYFELNLELVSPRDQAHVDLLPNKPYALVLIRAPSNVDLIADLKLNDQKIGGGHRIMFDDQKQRY
jgi:transglutaminase/protease-like cytokinesis protein 3